MSNSTAILFASADREVATRLFPHTPLAELGPETRLQLSELLNCKKYLRSENGYERDWRGLAELAQVRSFCHNNFSNDPMAIVLQEWCARYPQSATFAQLQQYLGTIDRWHVYEDILENLVIDALAYAAKLHEAAAAAANEAAAAAATAPEAHAPTPPEHEEFSPSAPPPSEQQDSSEHNAAPVNSNTPTNNNNNNNDINREILERENRLNAASMPMNAKTDEDAEKPEALEKVSPLTRHDIALVQRGMPLQQYDAIVLYADADIHYAVELQMKFEQNGNYKFRLFFKNRDLLAGAFSHVAIIELLERCHYLLLILTGNFLAIPENRFLMHYVQSEQIQDNTRRIIPLAYDNCLPKTLRGLHTLKYNSSSESFWQILADSISAPESLPFISSSQVGIQKPSPFVPNAFPPPSAPDLPTFYQGPPGQMPVGLSAQSSSADEKIKQAVQYLQDRDTPAKTKKKRKPMTVLKQIFSR